MLINANIYTLDDKKPWADTLVFDNGEILFVGSHEQAKE